eukprot:360078-Chlamydomonas_euryale.AAC.18
MSGHGRRGGAGRVGLRRGKGGKAAQSRTFATNQRSRDRAQRRTSRVRHQQKRHSGGTGGGTGGGGGTWTWRYQKH